MFSFKAALILWLCNTQAVELFSGNRFIVCGVMGNCHQMAVQKLSKFDFDIYFIFLSISFKRFSVPVKLVPLSY